MGQLILPALVLASLSLAYVARLMRSSLAESLRSDYVRTAVAKGLPRRRVVGVHTVRNSLIPVVTFIGADFGRRRHATRQCLPLLEGGAACRRPVSRSSRYATW